MQQPDQLTLFRAERFGVILRAVRTVQIELSCDPAIIPGPEAATHLLEQILHLARLVKTATQPQPQPTQPQEDHANVLP